MIPSRQVFQIPLVSCKDKFLRPFKHGKLSFIGQSKKELDHVVMWATYSPAEEVGTIEDITN